MIPTRPPIPTTFKIDLFCVVDEAVADETNNALLLLVWEVEVCELEI